MSIPTVSIVIPVYNYGRFVEEALRSVLGQTYRNLEVIVVDDGSTDDSRQRVASFSPSVRYIYQSNAGVASARNTGIRHSQGEYIAFLDADDVWLPCKIEYCVEALRKDPEMGVVYHWEALIDEAGKPMPQTKRPAYQGDVLEPLVLGCFFSPSMSMVTRVCLDRVGLFDPVLSQAEDWDMWLRIALAGYKFGCVSQVLTWHRIHGSNLSSNLVQHFERSRAVLDKIFSNTPPQPRTKLLRSVAYRNLFVRCAVNFMLSGQSQEASKLFASGVLLQPEVLSRPGFYLGLAVNMVPYGYRTSKELVARTDIVTAALTEMLWGLFSTPAISRAVAGRRRAAWSALWFALAALQGFGGQWFRAASSLAISLWTNPLVSIASLSRTLSGRWRHVRAALQI